MVVNPILKISSRALKERLTVPHSNVLGVYGTKLNLILPFLAKQKV